MLPKLCVWLMILKILLPIKEAAGDMVQAMQILKTKPRFSCDFW
jgi:hypothetical protein